MRAQWLSTVWSGLWQSLRCPLNDIDKSVRVVKKPRTIINAQVSGTIISHGAKYDRRKSICRFPQMRCVIIGIVFPFQSVLSAPSACFSINYGSWQIIRSNWHLLGSKQLRLWPWDCGVSKLLPNHFIGAPRLFSPSIYGHLDFWIRRWLGCSPKKFVELSKSSSTLD